MALVKMIARRVLTRSGRTLAPGDAFDATPLDAAILVYRQHAAFAPRTPPTEAVEPPARRHSKRRDITPEPEDAVTKRRDLTPERED